MAKVLIFSDYHLHNWNYGATYENGWNSRLLDQKKVGDQIVDLANQHRVDYVVFCGDLFHTHGKIESGPLSVASNLFTRLQENEREVFVLVGNHDLGREATSVDWLKDTGVNVVHDWAVMDDYEEKFGFIAYAKDEMTFKERVNQLSRRNLKYWFLHQGVSDIPVGSDFVIPNEFFDSDDVPDGVLAFTGHYHSHVWARDRIVVVGSPMQFNWSDKGDQRGCIILDTFTNMFKFFPLKSPRFVELNGTLMPLTLINPIQTAFKETIQGNFIKITDEIPSPFIEEVRSLLIKSGARSVEFSYKQAPAKIGMTTNVFDIEHLLEKYTIANDVPELGQTIREQLRGDTYETP